MNANPTLIFAPGSRFHHFGYKCDICSTFVSQCLLCRRATLQLPRKKSTSCGIFSCCFSRRSRLPSASISCHKVNDDDIHSRKHTVPAWFLTCMQDNNSLQIQPSLYVTQYCRLIRKLLPAQAEYVDSSGNSACPKTPEEVFFLLRRLRPCPRKAKCSAEAIAQDTIQEEC